MKGGRMGKPKRLSRTWKQFDHPYVKIIHKNWVRYLVLPARIHYHELDYLGPFLYDTWHCRRCKLMANLDTFKDYHCS